jgi:uncharacterized protein (TIGR03083 family)
VDPSAYLRHIGADAVALARAAAFDLHAAVPACPGWTVVDLVGHTGSVHRWVETMVRTEAGERLDRGRLPGPPADEESLVGWFRDGAARLVATLAEAGTERPVWNWSDEAQVSAFWHRRMAHETTVHRWDGEAAVGEPLGVEPELAADGIDELLTVFLPRHVEGAEALVGLGGTLHVHCADTAGEWLVELGDGTVAVTREHRKGDAAIRGGASDVLLFLWNRLPLDRVEVVGARAVAERWAEAVRW